MPLKERWETARLTLRRWAPEDRAPFARLNADPEVMAFFPGPLDREASDALADRIEAHFEAHGFGVWAVSLRGDDAFLGFVGLSRVSFEAPFSPAVELAYRLGRGAWGRGYAVEAAQEACRVGFSELGLREIVAFTVPENLRSRGVMERLGMRRDEAGDFEHPSLPEGHRLRRHVLYRLRALG